MLNCSPPEMFFRSTHTLSEKLHPSKSCLDTPFVISAAFAHTPILGGHNEPRHVGSREYTQYQTSNSIPVIATKPRSHNSLI